MTTITAAVKNAIDFLTHAQPAAAIGGAVSVAAEVQHALTDGHVVSWRTAVPVLIALVVSRFVYSPSSVAQAVEDAATAETKSAH